MTEASHLANVLDRVARLAINEGHSHGLKPAQWEALRYLAAANRFSRTPRALTDYLGLTKGTVSQTLMALERKGLIEKSTDQVDHRLVRIELTEAGRALLEGHDARPFDRVLAEMPEAARATLKTGLENLVKRQLDLAGRRPFGLCRTCRHFRADHPAGAPHRCALLDVTLSAVDSTSICAEMSEAAGAASVSPPEATGP